MAILTKLSTDDVAELARPFGLEATTWSPIEAGSVNTNGRVGCADGATYFLRVYEEQVLETARHEAALLRALADAGVPTPVPLPRLDGGGFVVPFGDKPVAIFPFVPGTMTCQRSVSVARTRVVGAALAQVHAAGANVLASDVGARVSAGRFGRHALLDRLAKLDPGALAPDVAAARAHLTAQLEGFARRDVGGDDARGELGFIHGDLFRDNVLFRDHGEVVLLDFESASRGPIAFDLAVTLLAWCFGADLDLDLARGLVEGYATVRPLRASTRAALFDEALFACARFATTRITDFELRPPGSGAYKDFRRWLARERALLALGADGLDRALFGPAPHPAR